MVRHSRANEFGKYLGYLGGQQQVGLTAASAQAGVGQGYANAVSANNNNASNTASNAALATGGAINSTISSALSAYGPRRGCSRAMANCPEAGFLNLTDSARPVGLG
jgi:hypothetical protein